VKKSLHVLILLICTTIAQHAFCAAGAEFCDRDSGELLLEAIFDGSFSVVKELVERGVDVNWYNGDKTPLTKALVIFDRDEELNYTQIINLLLDHGADVKSDPVIALAVRNKVPIRIIQKLLDYGADPRKCLIPNLTPKQEINSCKANDEAYFSKALALLEEWEAQSNTLAYLAKRFLRRQFG